MVGAKSIPIPRRELRVAHWRTRFLKQANLARIESRPLHKIYERRTMRIMRVLPLLVLLSLAACDRREQPENAPTPQPAETRSPATDPEPPTAPVEPGQTPPDKGTPADPKTGT
jgi:hypothetical protein